MKPLPCLLALSNVALCSGARAAPAAGFQAVSGGKLLETLLGLVLVLALIFILARVLKRMQSGAAGGSRLLRVVSSLNIGTRERILLLRVADKHILVAATPQNISPLHVFDEPVDLPAEATPEAPAFPGLLQSLSGGGDNR